MKKYLILIIINISPFILCQNTWQNKVNKIIELQQKYIKPPEHFFNDTLYRLDNEFDPMNYFKILKNIRIEPGLVLDYIFFYDTAGGTPLLYTRNSYSKPFTTLEQYKDSLNVELPEMSMKPKQLFYDKLFIEDSKDGYFEFAIIKIMGGQFYQYWHSLYNDTTIVCNISAAKRLLKEMYDEAIRFNELSRGSSYLNVDTLNKHTDEYYKAILNDIERIDFEPKIALFSDTALIKVIVFSKFGGLFEKTFLISRKYPHEIIQDNTIRILYFSVGYVM